MYAIRSYYALTRVLDLDELLAFVTRTIAVAVQPEGVAVYLEADGGFRRGIAQSGGPEGAFAAPDVAPAGVIRRLTAGPEPLVTRNNFV